MFRKTSAYLPLALAAAALATVGVALALNPGLRQARDEGAAAHLWQVLMAGQGLGIVYFALSWLRRAPQRAWPVTAVQVAAFLAACAPVFLLGL